MNMPNLISRVRSLTRDFTGSIFREQDVRDFINEGIHRVRQIVPELDNMYELLNNQEDVPLMPKQYHHLLSVYATSRCFGQDERHYQATTMMNEFEVKMEEMKSKIEAGEIVIVDPETGEPIANNIDTEYVITNNYFHPIKTNGAYSFPDVDPGVEGVE